MSTLKFLIALTLSAILSVGLYSLPLVIAQPVFSGPRTWQVLIGGQSDNMAVQAEGYYPRVITIDVGDTAVWTLNAAELDSVTEFVNEV